MAAQYLIGDTARPARGDHVQDRVFREEDTMPMGTVGARVDVSSDAMILAVSNLSVIAFVAAVIPAAMRLKALAIAPWEDREAKQLRGNARKSLEANFIKYRFDQKSDAT